MDNMKPSPLVNTELGGKISCTICKGVDYTNQICRTFAYIYCNIRGYNFKIYKNKQVHVRPSQRMEEYAFLIN